MFWSQGKQGRRDITKRMISALPGSSAGARRAGSRAAWWVLWHIWAQLSLWVFYSCWSLYMWGQAVIVRYKSTGVKALTAPFLLQVVLGRGRRDVLWHQHPLCTAQGSRRSLSQGWLPRAEGKSLVPAGQGSILSILGEQGAGQRNSEVPYGRERSFTIERNKKKVLPMQSPNHLEKNCFSSVTYSFWLFLLYFCMGCSPPIISLPLFYNPSLFSPTLFYFLFVFCSLLLHKLPFVSHLFLSLLVHNWLCIEGVKGLSPGITEQWSPWTVFCSALSSSCQHLCHLYLSSPFSISAKNAKSFGRPCLRNAHISGTVFPISPS